MGQVITLGFQEKFISRLAEIILKDFAKDPRDLSRIACVFGGRRPGMFLRRELAERVNKAYLPPRIFSMDELVDHLVSDGGFLRNAIDLDACYSLYRLAKEHAPAIVKGRDTFAEFLPWSREIISFIEQLDLEDIADEKLAGVQKSAAIGFEIPENINSMLEHIVRLRELYHADMLKRRQRSRGMKYLQASRDVGENKLDGFDKVIFANFFYLHASEQKIIKTLCDTGRGVCVFQGSSRVWPVLSKNFKIFGVDVAVEDGVSPGENVLHFYQGFDMHSQICLAREILKKIDDKRNTVIVLPRPESVVPLLTEISPLLQECNVSLGYPLQRSVLFGLFDHLCRMRESRKDDKYYARDYLNVLKHPLIKNLKLGPDMTVTRVLVHKIEELLQGQAESDISGSLFISLEDIENEPQVYNLSLELLGNTKFCGGAKELRQILKTLHDELLRVWDGIDDFRGFARALALFLDTLAGKSRLVEYPLNVKAMERLFELAEEFKALSFGVEKFGEDALWSVFLQKLRGEVLSFSGSPLRGTQILGLMETRSLNFDNVIVMDANEGVLPKLKIYEPLIPREVMLQLGLNRLEKEEEIQRYQFMRLLASASNVHLIYEENQKKERSRFIEELIWNKQKKENRLDVITIPRAAFCMSVSAPRQEIPKTREIVERLRKATYSASRLNVYLECPMKFYFRYVLGLQEKNNLLDDPEADSVGTFIHGLLEDTFKRFEGNRPVIDAAFKKYFFQVLEEKFARDIARRMKSDSFLLLGIVRSRLEKFLESEKDRDVKKIIGLEQDFYGTMFLRGEERKFRYTADRVDELADGSVVIIDYKTGSTDRRPKGLDGLAGMEMTRESIKNNLRSFQLPLYYYFVAKEFPNAIVNAELYSLRTMERAAFINQGDYSRREELMRICVQALEAVFAEMFDIDRPFTADRDEAGCQRCCYSGMCF